MDIFAVTPLVKGCRAVLAREKPPGFGRAGQKQLGVSCYLPARFHQSGLLQKFDSEAAAAGGGGICSLSWLATATLGLAVRAAPVNTSFVSLSKGDLGLVEEECVAFLRRKSVLLLNSHPGSAALRACFACGITDIGSEREDVLCVELKTSAASWRLMA